MKMSLIETQYQRVKDSVGGLVDLYLTSLVTFDQNLSFLPPLMTAMTVDTDHGNFRTLKACMCTFYLRLTEGLEGFSTKIYIGFGLVLSTWFAVLFGILFGCGLPFEKNWQIYPQPSNYCQPAISRIDIFMTVVLNVLTDFYLMSIPLPLLWKARVSGFKRVAMVFCFSGGLFVTTAGILRCVLIVTVRNLD